MSRKGRGHVMSDQRILGESDFVDRMLAEAGQAMNRCAALKARGYDLKLIAKRAAGIFGLDEEEIFLPGRQADKVKARSLACFWCARELGLSFSELARAFGMSVPGIGYAVERGKTLARVHNFTLED